jgi:hypothetical protein
MYEMDKSGHILIETGSVTLSGDSTFFFSYSFNRNVAVEEQVINHIQ